MLRVPFVFLPAPRRSGVQAWRNPLYIALMFVLPALPMAAQAGKITGKVADPDGKLVSGAAVTATKQNTHATVFTSTGDDGVYEFEGLPQGSYDLMVKAPGFKSAVATVSVTIEQAESTQNFTLALEQNVETVRVTSGSAENAYRVEHLERGGPLGTEPILNQPYTINVISRQLIDDTHVEKLQGGRQVPSTRLFSRDAGTRDCCVLKPAGCREPTCRATAGTEWDLPLPTPSAMEEYEQIEILNGAGGSMYGPSNPSGIFNFVAKRPTEEMLLGRGGV